MNVRLEAEKAVQAAQAAKQVKLDLPRQVSAGKLRGHRPLD